uniref:26S proteasome regulatory subunit Rpn7 N-terminal domain-containing protein n=1 Tax=Palpitomonas bilix TaxID=652834 RepID=A0A7S3G5H6_9EUKA|mmetsp:Transcript_28146/g.71750  ORF Transcript_28146/g.71750 Transcript_28146/m.71750 type:complete len:202 (+) Transcript_28146:3-608(+)
MQYCHTTITAKNKFRFQPVRLLSAMEDVPLDDMLAFAEKKFEAQNSGKTKLLKAVAEKALSLGLLDQYEEICSSIGEEMNASAVAAVREAHLKTLKGFDNRLEHAKENYGESEIADILCERAEVVVRTGNKGDSIDAISRAWGANVGLSKKLDLLFLALRLGFFLEDRPFIREKLDETKKLLETGADWERRNRLKGMVYLV